MRIPVTSLILSLAIATSVAQNQAIAPRPEQLKFPPLGYEPPAAKDYRVALKSGPIAYVVPDRELPLVNIVVLVHTGQYVEPAGKEGLAELTGYLLAHGGTSSKTAEALEERLAFLAAQLNAGVGETQGSVSLNLLSKDLPEGLAILREVLTQPRFQDDKITLRKQQMLQAMKQRNDESAAIEAREQGFLALGEKFWANRYSTAASVDSLTHADLDAFHHEWFFPSNFVVAVNGDFDKAQMVQQLESLFANWPFTGEAAPAIPTNTEMAAAGAYFVNKDVNQGRVAVMLPGILRENPDYFAIMVMNDILGGGGFTSRIVNRIRSDEGLAYHAYSSFPGGVYYPLTFTAGFQSKSRTVAYATSIIFEEMQRIATQPVSDVELSTSKQGFIDRFPNAFATKAQIASTLAQDEFTGRYAQDPDFWKNYRSHLKAVTKEDVERVAQKYLTAVKPVVLVVGNKQEILLGHPDHPVKIADLVGGKVTDWPLRDPLTMKQMSSP